MQEYEQMIFGSVDGGSSLPPTLPPSLSFGFPKINDSAPLPAFNPGGTPSIFARAPSDIAPAEFTFGAGPNGSCPPPQPTPTPPNPNGDYGWMTFGQGRLPN